MQVDGCKVLFGGVLAFTETAETAEQQAQQQEMINSLMQNANKLNEPVNQGSVLADMNNQLRGT